MDRRHFLQTASLGLTSVALTPRTAFASAPTEHRLVFVLLRGGLDGLHFLQPLDDRHYHRLRPTLAQPERQGGAPLKLSADFGLHPALSDLMPLYADGELLLMPAATTRYRDRSHFDGQNLLENGSARPFGAKTGWLNRALLSMPAHGAHRLGLSIGPAVPFVLQGEARVQAWSDASLPAVDDDFLRRLGRLVADDALFAQALRDGQDAPVPDLESAGTRRNPLRGEDFTRSARAAADLLARAAGPRVAVIDLDGWDTHFEQERRLKALFAQLATGLLSLKRGLAEHWARTVVVVVSEFGRTAAENGNRGTDHGTGGLAMLAGGAVRGGRVVGDWPGLSPGALWQARDVRPMNAYESIFKAVLTEHLALPPGVVEDVVFPASRSLPTMPGLFRV